MPVHNWKPIEAGIFHAMHHGWIEDLSRALNRGLLPSDYYALPEQITGGWGPDVLTLVNPSSQSREASSDDLGSHTGLALADAPPKVQWRLQAEAYAYAHKAKSVVVRHVSRHHVVALIEIVSPGNKKASSELQNFVRKAASFLKSGIHLVVVDLLPPGRFDPQGIHKAIWDEIVDSEFELPKEKPLTLASYRADECPEAFVEPYAVGDVLAEMPLFLTSETYIPVPLATTYDSAFNNMPAYWREAIAAN